MRDSGWMEQLDAELESESPEPAGKVIKTGTVAENGKYEIYEIS